MSYLARPWSLRSVPLEEGVAFGPSDCLLGTFSDAPPDRACSVLMTGRVQGHDTGVVLYPYPKRDRAEAPLRRGFPVRPRHGKDQTEVEQPGALALYHMKAVLARIQELEEALNDPSDTWGRLRHAWSLAENDANPRMAEIVRQARHMQPIVRDVTQRIRRVLRRNRELTPLDRVQEMDRASMVWLSRQPGRSTAERAGSGQRIMATVRRENFDTLENRVLHAYARLASDVARDWEREHASAGAGAARSARYQQVRAFRRACRGVARSLADLGVLCAPAGVPPNYVLMQDKSYRAVYDCWLRLLQRKKVEDDLWAWQAETWTDFASLAILLAIEGLEEAELIAQSPILWQPEAIRGRWFAQDRPIAVFWLRQTQRVVEIQARPADPGPLLMAARAHVALRITDPARADVPRKVAVWTPHAMTRLNLDRDVTEAATLLQQIQPLATTEVLRHGLILTPARGQAGSVTARQGQATVQGVAMGPAGAELAHGFKAVRGFVQSEIYRDMA